MRVLALADKRPPMDPALMAEQMGVQAVVCLGDLDRAWIESLTPASRSRSSGCTATTTRPACCARSRSRTYTGAHDVLFGMTVAGFEGCVRYWAAAARTTTRKSQAFEAGAGGCRPPTS